MSITLRKLETLKLGENVWDDKVKGFGARRQTANGAVSFILLARVKGRKRRFTVGRLGQPWTVETQRSPADAWQDSVWPRPLS